MVREEAALYEAPFRHAVEHVYPMRQRNRREAYRTYWWRHVEPRPGMWEALDGLSRYIVTPTVAKHRLFAWLDARVCPDHQLIVIARDDNTTFGILHSRFHEAMVSPPRYHASAREPTRAIPPPPPSKPTRSPRACRLMFLQQPMGTILAPLPSPKQRAGWSI